jgi:hypothetical protein
MLELSYDKLVEFLYLLMRDAAPTGEVVRVARMVKEGGDDEITFTSKELEAYAKRIAMEMLQ